MCKTIEEILAPKPEARPRLYAYSIADPAHAGLLKVGQTPRNVKPDKCSWNTTGETQRRKGRGEARRIGDWNTHTERGVIYGCFYSAKLRVLSVSAFLPSWCFCIVPAKQRVTEQLKTGGKA